MTHEEILYQFDQLRSKQLRHSLIIDAIGMASFLVPGIGFFADALYAPISALIIYNMYSVRIGKGKAALAGGFGGLEEITIFDFVPTASLIWIYTYKLKHDSTFYRFVEKLKKDRDIIDSILIGNPTATDYTPKPGFMQRLKGIGTSIISVFYEAPQKQLPEAPKQQVDILPAGESDNEFV